MLNRGVTGGILGSFSSSLKKGQTYHCDIMSTQEVGIFPSQLLLVSFCSRLITACSLLLSCYFCSLLFVHSLLSFVFRSLLFILYLLRFACYFLFFFSSSQFFYLQQSFFVLSQFFPLYRFLSLFSQKFSCRSLSFILMSINANNC